MYTKPPHTKPDNWSAKVSIISQADVGNIIYYLILLTESAGHSTWDLLHANHLVYPWAVIQGPTVNQSEHKIFILGKILKISSPTVANKLLSLEERWSINILIDKIL